MTIDPGKQNAVPAAGSRYDAAAWAGQASKSTFIWKFALRGAELPGWRLAKTVAEQVFNRARSFTYLWQPAAAGGESVVKLDFVEAPSWRAAHQALLDLLSGEHQAPSLPSAAERKLELGDVAYLGYGEPLQYAIFSRSNMVARLSSMGKQDISILELARQVDRLFTGAPPTPERGVRPEIVLFSAEKSSAAPGEATPLVLQAHDPLDRPLWFLLRADQGEFAADGERVSFIAEAAGTAQLSLYAINPNGLAALALTRVEVS